MGVGWVGITAYGGPERRRHTGLSLGSLFAYPLPAQESKVGGMGLRTLGSWESSGSHKTSREEVSDCMGESFPCSWPPESRWELGFGAQPRGRGGAGEAALARLPRPQQGLWGTGGGDAWALCSVLQMAGRLSPKA